MGVEQSCTREAVEELSCRRAGCDPLECDTPCCDTVPQLAWRRRTVEEMRLLQASFDGDIDKIKSLLEARAFVDTRKRTRIRPRGDGLQDYEDGLNPLATQARPKRGSRTSRGPHEKKPCDSVPEPEVLEMDAAGRFRSFGQASGRAIGQTPLMLSAQESQWKAVELLLSAKASVHCKDEDGMTPLHFAASAACLDSCRALLSARAHPEARDDDQRSALECVPKEALLAKADRTQWQTLLEAPKAPAPTVLQAPSSGSPAKRAAGDPGSRHTAGAAPQKPGITVISPLPDAIEQAPTEAPPLEADPATPL